MELRGSGLARAQLQRLLQGLADAGRTNLGILLRAVVVVATTAPSRTAAGHAESQLPQADLCVCLRRARLEVVQRPVAA